MNLSNTARQRVNQHLAFTAKAYSQAIGEQFSATPTIAQRIYDKIIVEGGQFLQSINVFPVSEMAGEKVGLLLTSRVASRTDTSSTGERSAKRILDTAATGYTLKATEFDVALTYALIDAWAKFPDFSARWQALVRKAIANDMLQTGWTGTSAATATNLGSNPLLQDLNIGWLKKIKDFNAGSQYVLGAAKGQANAVTLGTVDFKNLDVLAHVAKQRLPEQFRNNPDLVLLVGQDILATQEETYFELNGNQPTEKQVLTRLVTRAYGGMPTFAPPFMPNGTLLVTPLKNLSIYYQDTSVRRQQTDNPKKNQIEDWNSVNLGYVVEEEQLTSLVENVTF